MNAGQGFQLGDILGIVRRRAMLASGVALTVLLGSIFIAAILPNSYTAWTTILVEPQTVSRKLVEAGLEDSDLNARLHLMTMQILSRGRLSRIIDDLELYPSESQEMTREEVISLMRSHIHVEPVLPELEATDNLGRRAQDIEINTFRLHYRSRKADTAAAVANRLASDFIDEHLKERVQISSDTSEFLQSELGSLQQQIQEVEQRIAAVKDQNAGRLPEDLVANQRLLERTYESLRAARTQAALAESDRAFYAQQAIAAASSPPPGNVEVTPERKLEIVKLRLAEYRALGFTDRHPDVISTQLEIDEIERQLQIESERPRSEALPSNFAEENARAEQRRADLRAQAAQQEVARLQNDADATQARLAATPRVAEQLNALEREYQHLFASYQSYSAKGLEAGVAANMERRQKGEQFRILEAAFTPPRPSSPNRLVILLAGIMLGLATGAGVAILAESIDSSFHGARELQSALHVPVLATIPRILLESDRVARQRRRLLALLLAGALSAVMLVGSGVGYVMVNGMPGFVKQLIEGEAESTARASGAETRG